LSKPSNEIISISSLWEYNDASKHKDAIQKFIEKFKSITMTRVKAFLKKYQVTHNKRIAFH
jgi:hypothetical protein